MIHIRQPFYIFKNAMMLILLLLSEYGVYFTQTFDGGLRHHRPLFRRLP